MGILDGKRCIITGGAQGIGRAIALEFAAQGAAGIVVADRNLDGAQETAALAGAEALQVDLRRGDQIRTLVESAVSVLGGLDVVVNNAGVIESVLTDRPTTVDQWMRRSGTPFSK